MVGRARRRRIRARLLFALLPAVVRYLSPGYHPSRDAEPEQAIHWLKAYRDGSDLRAIDTTVPILAF